MDKAAASLTERARRALLADASPDAARRLDERWSALCQELVGEWITGERRFETSSQLAEHWIGRLYEDVHADERPDAARIAQRYALPMPRAQYLARALLARHAPQLRAAARTELRKSLGRLEKKARGAQAAGEAQTQRFEASLSRAAYDELVLLHEQVVRPIADRDRPAPPRKLPSSPGVVWFSVTAETLLAVLDELEKGAK